MADRLFEREDIIIACEPFSQSTNAHIFAFVLCAHSFSSLFQKLDAFAIRYTQHKLLAQND